jgi:phosphoglycolate phosphatase
MRGIKLIIFDLDGTLVDAYPAIIKSFNYTMRRFNYPLQSALIIRQAVGWGDKNLLKPFIKIKDLKRALFVYRKHHKTSLLKGARLFPRVDKLLTYLKDKGYHLAIASNRPTRFSGILIRHLGLEKYFDYVLCADRLKYIKPHPEILHKITQRFKVKPEETLYIGDMAIDAQAGRRAKVKTIIVTTGSSTKFQIKKEKPYRSIKRVADLCNIL